MKLNLNDYQELQPGVLTRTPEGYRTGRLCVTCAGVFPYLAEDGSGNLIKRLRPFDQVMAADSINSLNNKPVTLRHPTEDVTPDNVAKLGVGMSANDAWMDDQMNLWVTITVTDRKAIDAIEAGEVKAISCGYTATLRNETGNWHGVEYDQVMTGITYNHIALVLNGRAGDGVQFRVGDSADEFAKIFNTKQGDESPKDDLMKKIMIDSVEYQADEKVIDSLQATQKDLDESKAKIDTLTAERDAAVAERDEAKKNAMTAEQIGAMVDAKVALISKAQGYGAEIKAGDSDDAIKRAVISLAFGDSMSLEGKSDAYVEAAYDLACGKLEKASKETKKSPMEANLGDGKNENDNDPEKAFQEMMDGLQVSSNKKEA